MRRSDRDRNDTGGRGFRILEAGGRYLEPLTPPPPPRAPEPYKVASSSSSLGRAHRRSSFVIIAETRPATPGSRSPSPSLLATGRVSPFRGRGFKGPLPHAQSRAQSPENRQQGGRRAARYDRRASVSQQNSPKRSLIPQPTRRRSISLPKNNERKASPKFGRRAAAAALPVGRKNSNVTANGNLSQRQSLKAPLLSPIQGTPTKPTDGATRFIGGNGLIAKGSPVKSRNSLLAVPKNGPDPKRTTNQQPKSPSKKAAKTKRFVEEKKINGENESLTKIPTRRGSIVNKNGSTQSLSSSRFIGKNVKPPARAAKEKINTVKPDTNSSDNENGEILPNEENEKDDSKIREDLSGSRFIDMTLDSKNNDNDLGLMDLLKKSSGATGTSSVVNTTTTTAVQPLQIEAAAILLENDRAKMAVEMANAKNSTSSSIPASLEISPNAGPSPIITGETSSSSSLTKSSKIINTNNKTTTGKINEKKSENRENEISLGISSTPPVMKNSSQKTSGKGITEETNKKEQHNNGTNKGQTSRDKTLVGGGSKKNLLTRNGVQDGSRGEMRIPSGNPATRTLANSSNNTNNNNEKNISNEETGSARVESNGTMENGATSGKLLLVGKPAEAPTSLTSGHRKSDSRGSSQSANFTSNNDDKLNDGKRTLSRDVPITGMKNVDKNYVRAANPNGHNNKIHTDHGNSESSLKSSNGLSMSLSAESIRSTDTGVSVNTVRGVSSAREKKGLHMMKKSEEIETLSGNVMQLERNGEAAVLDIAEAAEDSQTQTRLGRLKKSLARFNDRLPSMRCLGCRRNQKGHAWLGEHRNQSREMQPNEPVIVDGNANPGNSRCNRMWTSLKNACRCRRLRECKCCRRAARVAPAESTSCCPPERRCGALCEKLFSRCKCNRSEAQNTSIRAKHSLTSVVPPPLSEEQRAKIPEVLVEHNSVMRGAIPCLPVPIAWFCLVWNVLIPGSGTVWSGIFNLCVGQPRFSVSAGPRARLGALIVNLLVGVGQFFTVLFCLVGWGWSIWWGVTMIRLARKYKRFRASEAASSDLEARAGEPTGLPPGVPSQALRGMERAR